MKTKYEVQIDAINAAIADYQSQITGLQAQQTTLSTLVSTATVGLKTAAIVLHTALCPYNHVHGAIGCSWQSVEHYDDAAQADFTESAHSTWLERAQVGIAELRELGFTITEPSGS